MRLTAFVLALAAGTALVANPAVAQVEKPAVKLTLGWLFQAPQAPYVYAAEKGYFKAEGMEVAIDRGAGSGASIQRVISGSHEIGHADMGVIIKWNAENPEKQLMVFYVPEDGYPLAIISLKDRANIINDLLFNVDQSWSQHPDYGWGPKGYVPNPLGTPSPALTAYLSDAAAPDVLVERLNQLLLHGTMRPAMRQSILTAVNKVAPAQPLRRVKLALNLILASVDYQIQK